MSLRTVKSCRSRRGTFPGTLGRAGLFFLLFSLAASAAQGAGTWAPLIERLAADGFEEQVLRGLFSRPEVSFDPTPMASKLETLIRNQARKTGAPPAAPSKAVYRGVLREKNLARARAYLQDHREILEEIRSRYCVPKEIIVSILLVETRLGDFLGSRWAFNSLASMALHPDLEAMRPHLPKALIQPGNEQYARGVCRQRADWAYGELKALLLYAEATGYDPLSLPGSIYGAIGICQFIPTSALAYGVDADRDGRVDLFVKADAFHSIANYLKGHGWTCQMDKADRHRVIFQYNRSTTYANTVLAVADKLKKPAAKK